MGDFQKILCLLFSRSCWFMNSQWIQTDFSEIYLSFYTAACVMTASHLWPTIGLKGALRAAFDFSMHSGLLLTTTLCTVGRFLITWTGHSGTQVRCCTGRLHRAELHPGSAAERSAFRLLFPFISNPDALIKYVLFPRMVGSTKGSWLLSLLLWFNLNIFIADIPWSKTKCRKC